MPPIGIGDGLGRPKINPSRKARLRTQKTPPQQQPARPEPKPIPKKRGPKP
jgi:hypothetical protein